MAEIDKVDEGEEEDEDGVILMRLDGGKGVELAAVLLMGMEEGVFGDRGSLMEDGEMEEEGGVGYVGMTRAEEEVYL
ncbi:3'-5' exonuclease [Bacillus altitudinis]|uniref:3'-5' exonuclease n=1 Tax=Bacillus altitudinis TaxID=293387 RepID=UPI001F33D1EB|nr:3'-5' exonuclease [Bacillus altitudinis]